MNDLEQRRRTRTEIELRVRRIRTRLGKVVIADITTAHVIRGPALKQLLEDQQFLLDQLAANNVVTALRDAAIFGKDSTRNAPGINPDLLDLLRQHAGL